MEAAEQMIRAAIAKRADGIVHGWDSGASSESDDAAVPADAAVTRRLERQRVEELTGGPAAGVRTQPLQPREVDTRVDELLAEAEREIDIAEAAAKQKRERSNAEQKAVGGNSHLLCVFERELHGHLARNRIPP